MSRAEPGERMVHKMKTLEEVLYDYTRGEKTLEEANKALKELGCGLTLDPTRNLFSARELLETAGGLRGDRARRGRAFPIPPRGSRPRGGRTVLLQGCRHRLPLPAVRRCP